MSLSIRILLLYCLAATALVIKGTDGFCPEQQPIRRKGSKLGNGFVWKLLAQKDARNDGAFALHRRSMFVFLVSLTLSQRLNPPSNAVVMEPPKDAIFQTGQAMGSEAAMRRFRDAQTALQYLIDNYDEIAKGGGDNVRRYLGTVGTTSALYGIGKVVKELQDLADDIVEYTESMNDFDYSLRAADTAVYSANFVEYSAAKTKPEKFFEDAKYQIGLMKKNMDVMAHELGIN